MRRRNIRHILPWLLPVALVVALAITLGGPVLTAVRGQSSRPTVHITVDRSTPLATSQFAPGITYADNSLDYPFAGNDSAAVMHARLLLGSAVTFQNTPIMAWGLPDPWPDPSAPEPTHWDALDARVSLIESTGSIPVLTLSEAPWWMKGQLQPDGRTLLLSEADEWSTRAYSSRILDNEMDSWLLLVQRVAERYMAPPYNVRYFQVWNELKGYYDPVTNAYDYTTSPGKPDGPHANHGYTYLYNRVYERLMSVATSLEIRTPEVKIGGPYAVMDTWSSPVQSDPSNLTKPYGTFDGRPMDAVKYWLGHKLGAGFIAVDVSNSNKNNVNLAYASAAAEKFADVVHWMRSLDDAKYPGATSLPIWLAEWYASPYDDWSNNDHSNAIKTYALMAFLKAGGAVALAWGVTDEGRSGPRLWTATGKGGGKALPFYASYRDFKRYFPVGTQLYAATVTTPDQVDVVASATAVMIVNKTPNTLVVSVNGAVTSLKPYQVTVVSEP